MLYNAAFFYYGFFALLAQLIIFRELSVLFYGSELFMGTFLACWLFWVGIGSRMAKKFEGKNSRKYFSRGFIICAAILPWQILLIRASKSLFTLGEFTGPLGVFIYTFSLVSVLCLVIGAQFALACGGFSLAGVYLYEALGAVAAGIIFTYVLIGAAPLFTVAIILSLAGTFMAWILSKNSGGVKKPWLVLVVLIIVSAGAVFEPAVHKIQWKGYRFIKQKEARNATLSLVAMGSTNSVFEDGELAASFPAAENYEPLAHWPLLASVNPKRILLLGAQSIGALKEVLKHNPQQVDLVMPDNAFFDFVKAYLLPEDRAGLRDKRVRIHYADARLFVKQASGKYDVLIVNIPEVSNLKLNRYYTREFFDRIKYLLTPQGILALNVASSENYLSEPALKYDASVFRTLRSVFPEVEAIPGDSAIFLSGSTAIDLSLETLLNRLGQRSIVTHYLVPSYIANKLDKARRLEFRKMLEQAGGVELNTDFKPSTFYYFSSLWQNRFVSNLGYLAGMVLFILISLSISGRIKREGVFGFKKEEALIFCIGFMSMAMELILLVSFQVISGYVYWQMGVLFAAFMSGLFLGAAAGRTKAGMSRGQYFFILSGLTLVLVLTALCVGYELRQLAELSSKQNIAIFLSLLFFIGVAAGEAFVVSGFFADLEGPIQKAGALYSADLWGAAIGALLTTNFILPIFGVTGAMCFISAVGVFGLGIFIFKKTGEHEEFLGKV